MTKAKKADAGDGCLFQRKRKVKGRVYYDNAVIITRDDEGNQVRILLHTKVPEEAKQKYREWLLAKNAGDNSIIDGRIAVCEYLDRWLAAKSNDAIEPDAIHPKTIGKYGKYISHFTNYLKESGNEFLQMKDVKDSHLKGYQARRLKQTRCGKPGGVPITPEGVNREMKFLKGIFKNAYHDCLIPKDPTKGVDNFRAPLGTAVFEHASFR